MNNDLEQDDSYLDDEESEQTFCPKCGRDYDDADQDFLICHYCTWSVNSNKYVGRIYS